MSKVIVTYVSGPIYEKMFDISGPAMGAYAESIAADFYVVRDAVTTKHGELSKFKVSRVFREYDRSLFLDVDILINAHAPDIFSVVPEGRIGAFDELPYYGGSKRWWKIQRPADIRKSQGMLGGTIVGLNSGVFVLDRQHAHLYDPPRMPLPDIRLAEQGLFSARVQDSGLLFSLPARWNYSINMPAFSVEAPVAHFVHFNARPQSRRLEAMRKFCTEGIK